MPALPGTIHTTEMMVSDSLTGVSDLTNQSRGIRWKCASLLEVANANELAQKPSWKEESLCAVNGKWAVCAHVAPCGNLNF